MNKKQAAILFITKIIIALLMLWLLFKVPLYVCSGLAIAVIISFAYGYYLGKPEISDKDIKKKKKKLKKILKL